MDGDLISRSALLAKMKQTPRYFDVKFDIEEATAVDSVPVVRCKDCKHFTRSTENETVCDCIGGLAEPEESDFCSYGDRKEDGI